MYLRLGLWHISPVTIRQNTTTTYTQGVVGGLDWVDAPEQGYCKYANRNFIVYYVSWDWCVRATPLSVSNTLIYTDCKPCQT